jgi:hypothetical protein
LDTPATTLPTSTWASFNQARSTQGRIPATLHNPHQRTGSGGPVFFGGSSAAAPSWFVPWRRAAPSAGPISNWPFCPDRSARSGWRGTGRGERGRGVTPGDDLFRAGRFRALWFRSAGSGRAGRERRCSQVEPRQGLGFRLEIKLQRPAAPDKERDTPLHRPATDMAKNFRLQSPHPWTVQP